MTRKKTINQDNTRDYKLIFAVTEKRFLGVIINAFAVYTENNFYKVYETITNDNYSKYSFSEREKNIIDIINEYSENAILKIFSKAKNSKEFFQNLDKNFFEERIRPYIEKRIIKIIEQIISFKIPLFIKDKNFNTIHFDDQLFIPEAEAIPLFNFTYGDTESSYSLNLSINDKEINLENKNHIILSQSPCIVIIDKVLLRVKDIDAKKLLPFFSKKFIAIPKSARHKFFSTFVLNAIEKFIVNVNGFEVREIKNERYAELYLGENLNLEPVLFLRFWYGENKINHNTIRKAIIEFYEDNEKYIYKKYIRDTKWEDEIINYLEDLGLKWFDMNYFKLEDNENKEIYGYISWINENIETVEEKQIKLSGTLGGRNYFKGKIDLTINIEKRNDWFDIHAQVFIGQYKYPFSAFRRYILNQIREFPLPNGEIAVLPLEWYSKYKDIYEFGHDKGDHIMIKNFHFNLLNNKLKNIDFSFYDRISELVNAEKIEKIKLPSNIKATLRPYQIIGYQWMVNLQKNKFGGCLADDMGLGKTLQTLALLQNSREKIENKALTKQPKKEKFQMASLFPEEELNNLTSIKSPTSLIIVPASLVHNWVNEIKKFTPQLKVYKFTGTKRTREQYDFNYYDIIITTYGVIRNDIDILQNFYFHYIILDESQIIKNPFSKIYKAILKLQSEYKLVLTGTPIENSLTDLWSQINFVNRGLLGNLAYFKKEFVTPIEKNNDNLQQEKLKMLITPFILRRNKNEVEKDLPPVTEQYIFCEMTDEHASIYNEEKSKLRNLIFETIEKEGIQKSTIVILQGLSRLRQLANHPILIYPEYEYDSGKFNETLRHIKTIFSEGHKCLIFSSYVKHLNLLKTYFDKEKIDYSFLTGSTRNREEIINNFQKNPFNQIFLISLKAGGTGLNLTAADYVYILDPWWNPAAENQAISRAHRIGQDKKVFIYKFITTNTIEEKIKDLQEKKANIANLFVNTNNPFKDFNFEELKNLFS
jgi:SNF2 family DNA or RNA helicase